MPKKKETPEVAPLPPAPPEECLNTRQAAACLGITERALWLRLYKGQPIPHTRLGREYRFIKSELQAWRRSNPAPFRRHEIVSRTTTRPYYPRKKKPVEETPQ